MSEAEVPSTPIETPTSDPIEEQARSRGWVSEEEWKESPDNKGKPWRSAREFVERGEMIGEIRSMRGEVEKMRSTMRETMDQQAKAIRKTLEEKYRKDFDSAVDEGDKAKAAKAADELAKLSEPVPEEPKVDPAVESFKTRNKWFSETATDPVDKEMSEMAIALDIALHRGGNESTSSRLEIVEKRIKQMFPEKFANPARERAQTVETGGQIRRVGKKSVPALESLGPDFVNVGRKLVKSGVFKSESDYVQSVSYTHLTLPTNREV